MKALALILLSSMLAANVSSIKIKSILHGTNSAAVLGQDKSFSQIGQDVKLTLTDDNRKALPDHAAAYYKRNGEFVKTEYQKDNNNPILLCYTFKFG